MIQVENYTIIENKAEYEEWYDSEICYTRKKGACLLGKPTTFPAVFFYYPGLGASSRGTEELQKTPGKIKETKEKMVARLKWLIKHYGETLKKVENTI
jgi:hypothetical protein